jgi:hypothetical protein
MRKIFLILVLLAGCRTVIAQSVLTPSASGVVTVDASACGLGGAAQSACAFKLTLTANAALAIINAQGGQTVKMFINPGTFTLTWPSNVPTPPTLTASTNNSITLQYDGYAGSWYVVGGSSSGGSANFPALMNQFSDSFNRTAGNLGANWTNYLNGFTVTPGVVVGTALSAGGTQINLAAYTGSTVSNFSTSRISLLSGGTAGTGFPGAVVSISGTIGTSVSFYVCNESSTTLQLQKVTAASNTTLPFSTLASVGVSGAAGDTLSLTRMGNTLTCQRNGISPALEVTDASPLPQGLPGIAAVDTSPQISTAIVFNPIAPSNATYNIVVDGNSIAAANGNGSSITDPFTGFLFMPVATAYVTNLAVNAKCLGIGCPALNSGTIESMLSTLTSVINPLFQAGKKNLLILPFSCTNDIQNGQTPAQCLTNMTTYITTAHATGWKVIVTPELSRQTTSSPSLDGKLQIMSSLILANSEGADAIVVLNGSITNAGSSLNTNLFNADQIHPTEIVHTYFLARQFSATLSQF